jgi:hypothetical protein
VRPWSALRRHVFAVLLALLASLAAAGDVDAEGELVSAGEVLELIAKIPAECGLYVTPGCPRGNLGHYERGPSVRAIAQAIASHARDREEAATAAVFAAYESGMNAHAKGDKKAGVYHSRGPWALYDVSPDVAEDPDRAIVRWLAIKRDAETRCAENPPAERLAVLASGHCDRGKKKVRVRMRVVHELVAAWGE